MNRCGLPIEIVVMTGFLPIPSPSEHTDGKFRANASHLHEQSTKDYIDRFHRRKYCMERWPQREFRQPHERNPLRLGLSVSYSWLPGLWHILQRRPSQVDDSMLARVCRIGVPRETGVMGAAKWLLRSGIWRNWVSSGPYCLDSFLGERKEVGISSMSNNTNLASLSGLKTYFPSFIHPSSSSTFNQTPTR